MEREEKRGEISISSMFYCYWARSDEASLFRSVFPHRVTDEKQLLLHKGDERVVQGGGQGNVSTRNRSVVHSPVSKAIFIKSQKRKNIYSCRGTRNKGNWIGGRQDCFLLEDAFFVALKATALLAFVAAFMTRPINRMRWHVRRSDELNTVLGYTFQQYSIPNSSKTLVWGRGYK